MRRITILGSTGSIGVSTLRLLEETGKAGEGYHITALTGGRNAEKLADQALKFRPDITVLGDQSQWPILRDRLIHSGLEIACGADAVVEAARRPADWIMAAIVGIAGMRPVWAAAGTGATIALANKESLVCCGRALLERAASAGGRVLPVDSEHNAIFQVLDERQRDKVSRLILTASGGPFRGLTRDQLRGVTVEEALKHPNWTMGAKITIDSATLANKGLELIEAAILFDMPPDRIDVLIHPQSVIHSLVEYADGSSLAQLGTPDMRVPISYCLGWPDRLPWNAPGLDLRTIGALTFHEPDVTAFPMLALARAALDGGEGLTTVFNAANEVCVQAFLEKRIDFLQIAEFAEMAMMRAQLPSMASLRHASRDRTVGNMDIALEIDSGVRELVGGFVADARLRA